MTWLLTDILPELAGLASSRQQDSQTPRDLMAWACIGQAETQGGGRDTQTRRRQASRGGVRPLYTWAVTLKVQATKISLVKPGAGRVIRT